MGVNTTIEEASAPGDRGFEFSDHHFWSIARLSRDRFGLDLPISKKALVYSRLSKRLRHHDFRSFGDYLDLLGTPEGASEAEHMLSALTTNVTHFFRENHHFDLLRSSILPPLIDRAKAGGRVRLWSAGCSAGQEPYSMAAVLLDLFPEAALHDVKLLATDVDPEILARAKTARYLLDEMQAIPPAMRQRMVDDSPDDPWSFSIAEPVKRLVTLGQSNLVGEWPMRGRFDAIFCRNVAIYFDTATQAALWPRFSAQLNTGGYLIIGHSERLTPDAGAVFDAVGVTAFRKRTDIPQDISQQESPA